MSDYDFRPGGSLKLKGVADGGVTKKKKKSSSSKTSAKTQALDLSESGGASSSALRELSGSPAGSARASPGAGGVSASDSKRTDAERRFEEIQKQRLAKRVAKLAGKTHKERVSEFNSKLETLSEHHDIPKVGPG
ncbi:DUF1754-domain-containing protein [Auriculariales sp. MPI-PUGE-AT-0066]|nr:DUF1754-domain-containing protein [Auriculariales sp. MPI-PUGE-AT-0066]